MNTYEQEMTALNAIKNWVRVEPELRIPPRWIDLRKAIGLTEREGKPLYKRAKKEVSEEKFTQKKLAAILGKSPPPKIKPIPSSFSQEEEPEDPLAEYETGGEFDSSKFLADKGKEANLGLLTAMRRGDASALRLYYQLQGELDKPPEETKGLNADEIASRVSIALRELDEGKYRVGRDRMVEV